MAERVSKLYVLGALRGDKSLDFSALILPKFRPLPLPCFPCRLNSALESILREAVLGYEVNSAFMQCLHGNLFAHKSGERDYGYMLKNK